MSNLSTETIADAHQRAQGHAAFSGFDYALDHARDREDLRAKVWWLIQTVLTLAAANPWWLRLLPKKWRALVETAVKLAVLIVNPKAK